MENEEKAVRESKCESKVLVEVNGRGKGSRPDFRICHLLGIIFMYLSFLEELIMGMDFMFVCFKSV